MMANRSKQRGTAWETAIVNCLKAKGWPFTERRALSGNLDRGDIAGIPGVVIEAKDVKRHTLAVWLDEANIECTNDKADVGVVWVKRPRKTDPLDGYVIMDGSTFLWLLRSAGYGGKP